MIIDIPINLMFCYINYHFGHRYSSGSGDLMLVDDVCLDDPKSNLRFGKDVDFDDISGCGELVLVGLLEKIRQKSPLERAGRPMWA